MLTFIPPHGSFGIGPRKQLENGVSATSTLAKEKFHAFDDSTTQDARISHGTGYF
jgi:hypothetical protein